jgi:protein-S-isoprenylcysteine O-methyltransferase Ste14
MTRLVLFLLGSACLLVLSRKPLKNPGVHGFYRFFVFEGILAIILLNYPFWFTDPFSPLHLFSWMLLAFSVYYIIASLLLLKRHGGQQKRKTMPENFSFENTVHVVDKGLYRYVRHPMYSSLLFLGWGAFCKHPTWLTGTITLCITFFLFAAARVEEKENIQFFGQEYVLYMERSKRFIPWFF